MTITCNLKGGLGNQLFQIFTTISTAKKSNDSFIFFDNEYLGSSENITIRQTYWNTFLSSLIPYLVNDKKINIELKTNKYSLLEYKEKTFSYTPLPKFTPHKNDLVFLNGYFQSPKYFESHKKDIINLLNIQKYKLDIIDQFKSDYNFSNITTLHFRLGDYKKLHKYHPITTIKYYVDSIIYITKYLSTLNYLSDIENNTPITIMYVYEENEIDNKIVQELLQKIKTALPKEILNNLNFIKIPSVLSDWQQLLFMSCCSNNIIANSTFSWWGAFLNDNNKKMVCYPSIWFGEDNKQNTNDLFPPEWKEIEC